MGGGAGGQVAVAGGVQAGARAVAQHRVRERGEPGRVGDHRRPGAADAGAVHVVHPAALRIRGQPVGGRVLPGLAQLGPVGGGPVGGGTGGRGRPAVRGTAGALAEEPEPVARPAADPQRGHHYHYVVDGGHRVGGVLGGHRVVAEDPRVRHHTEGQRVERQPVVGPDHEPRQGDGDQRGAHRARGLRVVHRVPPEDLAPVAEVAEDIDDRDRDQAVVGGERGQCGRGPAVQPPPVGRREQFEQHHPVRHVPVAPQRPHEDGPEQRDHRAAEQRPVRHPVDGVGGARPVPVPPQPRLGGGARGPQPLAQRRAPGGPGGLRREGGRQRRDGRRRGRPRHRPRLGAPCVVRAFGVHRPFAP